MTSLEFCGGAKLLYVLVKSLLKDSGAIVHPDKICTSLFSFSDKIALQVLIFEFIHEQAFSRVGQVI